MTILEALAFFDGPRNFWKIGSGGCSIYARNEVHFVRASVRRKKGESLADMIVRCAVEAKRRLKTGWRPPEKQKRTPKDERLSRAEREARLLKFDDTRRPS